MKFLLACRSLRFQPDASDASGQADLVTALRSCLSRGLVEAFYVCVSGGLVLIVNAESHGALLAALRESGLVDVTVPEIFEIATVHS